eukprot:GHVL01021267.1.p1 GENE.GHVL01021267.1~~GHVL01021267.1.p1  ORF type:complete len:216 (+),score=24.86 GHVL01021267.1:355-1002(+)
MMYIDSRNKELLWHDSAECTLWKKDVEGCQSWSSICLLLLWMLGRFKKKCQLVKNYIRGFKKRYNVKDDITSCDEKNKKTKIKDEWIDIKAGDIPYSDVKVGDLVVIANSKDRKEPFKLAEVVEICGRPKIKNFERCDYHYSPSQVDMRYYSSSKSIMGSGATIVFKAPSVSSMLPKGKMDLENRPVWQPSQYLTNVLLSIYPNWEYGKVWKKLI